MMCIPEDSTGLCLDVCGWRMRGRETLAVFAMTHSSPASAETEWAALVSRRIRVRRPLQMRKNKLNDKRVHINYRMVCSVRCAVCDYLFIGFMMKWMDDLSC